jgi:hypothetical protein
VGSPEEVAEELVAWVDETDVDGFNLAYAVTPESFADFVDLVVPELQKRGHYEMEYAPGTVRSTTIASPASYSRPCWPGKRQPIKPLGFRLPSPDFSPVDAACMCRSAPVSAWKWDHEFESAFLQQAVCLSSERRGCRRKVPHFGGGLRVAGDVRRDVQAANRGSFALSL